MAFSDSLTFSLGANEIFTRPEINIGRLTALVGATFFSFLTFHLAPSCDQYVTVL